MAMRRQQDGQGELLVSWPEMAHAPGHVFYDRLQPVLIGDRCTARAFHAGRGGYLLRRVEVVQTSAQFVSCKRQPPGTIGPSNRNAPTIASESRLSTRDGRPRRFPKATETTMVPRRLRGDEAATPDGQSNKWPRLLPWNHSNEQSPGHGAHGAHACICAYAALSLSASAVVVARRFAAHASRSDLR